VYEERWVIPLISVWITCQLQWQACTHSDRWQPSGGVRIAKQLLAEAGLFLTFPYGILLKLFYQLASLIIYDFIYLSGCSKKFVPIQTTIKNA
jgi:hypothetical protein